MAFSIHALIRRQWEASVVERDSIQNAPILALEFVIDRLDYLVHAGTGRVARDGGAKKKTPEEEDC
ncbi:MAG TPA: hypothetical protein VF800_09065 [Telluria sp.]|jgi:hypothetical protein